MKKTKCCIDCSEWCGRCTQGKINRIAWSRACEEFESKYRAIYVVPEILEVTA